MVPVSVACQTQRAICASADKKTSETIFLRLRCAATAKNVQLLLLISAINAPGNEVLDLEIMKQHVAVTHVQHLAVSLSR